MEKRTDFNLFGVFLGILNLACGWISISKLEAPFSKQMMFFGLSMVLSGIIYCSQFKSNKQKQFLMNAIVGTLAGALFIIESYTMFIDEKTMIILFSFFVLALGVSEIVGSYSKKKTIGGFWVLSAIVGTIIILSAFNTYYNPFNVTINVGLSVGFDIILVGVTIILISL